MPLRRLFARGVRRLLGERRPPVSKTVLIADLLRAGHVVRFRATGQSMAPAIADSELVTAEPARPGEVRVGDVVVYARGGRVFAHRLIKIDGDGASVRFVMRGDNLPAADRPVGPEAILGRVRQARAA